MAASRLVPIVPVRPTPLHRPPLATAWPDLDRFEGTGYRRILVPIFGTEPGPEQPGERRLRTVANLYSANEAGPEV